MDYDSILRDRDFYERKLYRRYADLERAKMNNEIREQLMAQRDEISSLLDEINQYAYDIKRLLAVTEKEDFEFKNRRLDYVSMLITDSLQKIFPDDGLVAKLSCEFNRKSEVVLDLLDRDGNELSPDICSGKLQQYLISFAAVAGIANGLGIKNLYVDEAFGVAAPEILGEVGKIVQQSVDNGMQIIIIAQNSGLYQDLPRREIKLRKDPKSKKVEIVSETDY